MMYSNQNDFIIAKVKLIALKEFLPSIVGMVQSIASQLGYEKNSVYKLEVAVEESCLNVIEHAFDEGEIGNFEIVFERKPGKLVIAIEDKGLPFDFSKIESGDTSGLGMLLIKAFADEVKFINLGRSGKRLELIKSLPYKDVEEYISKEEAEQSKKLPQADSSEPLKFLMMDSSHTVNLARCVYRSYGYSYPNDTIYFPDRRRELIESGLLEACIVINVNDEIVGHLAMVKDTPDAKVGESGQAVVDPRYRGRSLFKEMKIFLSENAKSKGMYGLYSEAVSIHPFTQRGNLSLGAHETGFLLAFAPESMSFKQIKDKQKQRQTTVLFYHRINEEPHRVVYLPYHHASIIKKIYENLDLKRDYDVKKYSQVMRNEKTKIDMKVLPDLALSFLQLQEYGKDFESLIEFRFKEMLKKKMDCIYLDLPLTDELTPQFCVLAEQFGFFFAGIIPELSDGDVIRFQYLNNLEVDSKEICTASEFGSNLLIYVLKEGGYN